MFTKQILQLKRSEVALIPADNHSKLLLIFPGQRRPEAKNQNLSRPNKSSDPQSQLLLGIELGEAVQ